MSTALNNALYLDKLTSGSYGVIGPQAGLSAGLNTQTLNNINNVSIPVATTQYSSPIGPQLNAAVTGTYAGAKTGTNTTPTSGGGGGGQVLGDSTSSAPSIDPLQQELDSIYNPVFDALNNQESTLRQNYAPVEGQIRAEGDLSTQSVTDQFNSGNRELSSQENAAGNRKTDALTAATRLYNELQRGGQQRFGGASSAGEAYQTLTATEQQRRQGTIYSAWDTAMQQIGTLKANLQEKFLTAKKEIALQTQQAISQARSDFNNALASINSQRGQAQSDKATASMNALQDLRNKVYTINMQALQFTQQLALNHEANQKQVDDMTTRVYNSLSSGQNTVNNFGTLAMNTAGQTKYGITAGQASTPTMQTGQITPTKKYDIYGNEIA